MVSPRLRYRILRRDSFKCQYCGKTANDGVKLEVDHIIPRSLGGTNNEDNLQVACIECNRGKSGSELLSNQSYTKQELIPRILKSIHIPIITSQFTQYTQSQLLSILKNHPSSQLSEIQSLLKCGTSTAKRLVYDAVKEGKVARVNMGHEKRPLYVYSLNEKGKSQK